MAANIHRSPIRIQSVRYYRKSRADKAVFDRPASIRRANETHTILLSRATTRFSVIVESETCSRPAQLPQFGSSCRMPAAPGLPRRRTACAQVTAVHVVTVIAGPDIPGACILIRRRIVVGTAAGGGYPDRDTLEVRRRSAHPATSDTIRAGTRPTRAAAGILRVRSRRKAKCCKRERGDENHSPHAYLSSRRREDETNAPPRSTNSQRMTESRFRQGAKSSM